MSHTEMVAIPINVPRKFFSWLPCWHAWDLIPDADLGDVRTCARCRRRDVLTVYGWERLPPPPKGDTDNG